MRINEYYGLLHSNSIQTRSDPLPPVVFKSDNKVIHLLKGHQAAVRKIDGLQRGGGVPSKTESFSTRRDEKLVEIPITIGPTGLTTHRLTGVQDPGITTFKHYLTPCTKRDFHSIYQQIRHLMKPKVSLLPVQRNENLDHIPECYFSDIHSNSVIKFSN